MDLNLVVNQLGVIDLEKEPTIRTIRVATAIILAFTAIDVGFASLTVDQ
jgi:hypothetical protein